LASVCRTTLTPFDGLSNVTDAEAIPAPLGSLMVPRTLAVSNWARAHGAARRISASRMHSALAVPEAIFRRDEGEASGFFPRTVMVRMRLAPSSFAVGNARTVTMRVAQTQSIRSNTGVKAVCLLFSVLFIRRESSHLTVKRGRKERIAVYGIFIWHVCTGCNAR
jgi:hypothetical protein